MSKKEISKNNKKKKEMNDTTRIVLFTIVIVVVVSILGLSCYFLLREKNPDKPSEIKKNVNVIDGYGYSVDDLDSPYYKTEFSKLKENLEGKNIDFNAYAESLAKLFIIDVYTIDTKINKYDIGGVDFVLDSAKDNFTLNITNTLYRYVQDNSNGDRNQSLPVVSDVVITKTEHDKYEIKETKEKLDSVVFDMTISYETDLGYDKKAEVILVKKDNKYYVVEKN